MPQAIVLMGVSGSGKTSVGLRLSEILGWRFFDGDDLHPRENIVKMTSGIPLNDDDRSAWLESLHDLIEGQLNEGYSILVACSALKRKYRDQLRKGNPGLTFVYLKGDYELIFSRMEGRKTHYMDSRMLQSQFDDLEEPKQAIVINIDQNVESIVIQILQNLDLDNYRSNDGTKS